jgi:hypothetical protein
MLEAAACEPYFNFTEQMQNPFKHELGEQIPLPMERKILGREVIDHTRLMAMDITQRGSYVRAATARGIALVLESPGIMDITEEVDMDRFGTICTGSVYVFNEEQMRSFIRDIEDAVKESLST